VGDRDESDRPQTCAALKLCRHSVEHVLEAAFREPALDCTSHRPTRPTMTASATLPRNDHRLVFTSSQAARYLGVSLATIRRWTDAGHVSCYRTPGGQRRFARDQLDEFMSSMQRNAAVEHVPPTHGAEPGPPSVRAA
jgi:excisionase family DNA binding protein